MLNTIKQNRFYVLTDDVWNDVIEMRPENVLPGNPPTPSKEVLRMYERAANQNN